VGGTPGWPLVLAALDVAARVVSSQPDVLPPDYPRSLERDLRSLEAGGADHSSDVGRLVRLADVYLNIGDDLLTDPDQRRGAYEAGARAAARAIDREETCAEAHSLYAANLGSAVRLKGRAAAGLALAGIKRHAARAIELRPDYPEALQLMGGLLAQLPRLLGGDRDAAQTYLERAVAIDGNFTNARIQLARLYIARGRVAAARHQLEAVVDARHPHYPYAWRRRFRPEAQQLLETLGDRPRP
jgi:tetratricopeptide (TPR) repeat protein